MKFEAKTSVCSPKECPATFSIDGTSVKLGAKGSPSVELSPVALDLPKIDFEDLKLTVNPTDVTLSVTDQGAVFLVGLLGLKDAHNAIGELIKALPFVGEDESESDSEASNRDIKPLLKLALSETTVNVSGDMNLGSFRIRGIPIGGDVATLWAKAKSDNAEVAVSFEGLVGKLMGCLVANGGDCGGCGSCSGCKEGKDQEPIREPSACPYVMPVRAKYSAPFEVLGQNLGSSEGEIHVTNDSGDRITMTILSWAPTRIRAESPEPLPQGNYTIQVLTSTGHFSNSVPMKILEG